MVGLVYWLLVTGYWSLVTGSHRRVYLFIRLLDLHMKIYYYSCTIVVQVSIVSNCRLTGLDIVVRLFIAGLATRL